MSPATVVIRGTTGPCYQAALHLVIEWQRREGAPEYLTISTSRSGVVLTADWRLARFVADEINHLSLEISVRAVGAKWPGGGDPPSSCRAEIY